MPEAQGVWNIERSEDRAVNASNSSSNDSAELRGTPAVRRRLPDERHSLTHHFSVVAEEGYVTIGLYEDGLPGEMFIRMAKEGSTVSGLMDSFATAVSLALQYGVPLQVLCDKFSHTRFEPSGWSVESENWLREIADGLLVPLARIAIPERRTGDPI